MASTAVEYSKEKDIEVNQKEETFEFKIILTHKKSKGLEVAVRDIEKRIKKIIEDGEEVKARGVMRLPTKKMVLTVRKSPCGNGTNTYDRLEMRIHKRVFNIICSRQSLSKIITGVHTEPGMILEVNEF